MVTAESLYIQSVSDPTDFGTKVVPSSVTDPEEQKVLALAHIETLILPTAISEVSVPFMKGAQGNSLPFSADIILRKYPLLTEPAQQTAINNNIQALYDAAVTAFGRSEINSQVSTNEKSYDEDEDQDRKTAQDRLQKLLDAVNDLLFGPPEGIPGIGDSMGRLASTSVNNEYVF